MNDRIAQIMPLRLAATLGLLALSLLNPVARAADPVQVDDEALTLSIIKNYQVSLAGRDQDFKPLQIEIIKNTQRLVRLEKHNLATLRKKNPNAELDLITAIQLRRDEIQKTLARLDKTSKELAKSRRTSTATSTGEQLLLSGEYESVRRSFTRDYSSAVNDGQLPESYIKDNFYADLIIRKTLDEESSLLNQISDKLKQKHGLLPPLTPIPQSAQPVLPPTQESMPPLPLPPVLADTYKGAKNKAEGSLGPQLESPGEPKPVGNTLLAPAY